MSFNYDYTRKDGTEVMVTYRFSRAENDFFAGGCWHPGDDAEVDFGKVYGLPEGEELTADEYDEIEAAIFADPPDYDPTDDYL
jgi:hypothetical protein